MREEPRRLVILSMFTCQELPNVISGFNELIIHNSSIICKDFIQTKSTYA